MKKFFGKVEFSSELKIRAKKLFEAYIQNPYNRLSVSSETKGFILGVSSTVLVAGIVYWKQSADGRATEDKIRKDILSQSLRYVVNEIRFRANKVKRAESSIERLVVLQEKFKTEHSQHWVSREYAETKLLDYELRINELKAEVIHADKELVFLEDLRRNIDRSLADLLDESIMLDNHTETKLLNKQ